jgi:putative FmdB family regulatory protein
MPIYEYACSKCDSEFELLISGSAKPICPQCGSAKLQRKFSTFAAHQGSASAPACAESGCPGANTSACAGGKCPFSGH